MDPERQYTYEEYLERGRRGLDTIQEWSEDYLKIPIKSCHRQLIGEIFDSIIMWPFLYPEHPPGSVPYSMFVSTYLSAALVVGRRTILEEFEDAQGKLSLVKMIVFWIKQKILARRQFGKRGGDELS